jgi:hypothetical protein
MIDYQKLVRNWKQNGLSEGEAPSLKSYLQSITEILSKLKLYSKSDQRRVEIARQHIKEVKKYTRKLEERVNILEEQVQLLEEKELKNIEEGILPEGHMLVSFSGDTPEDIASDMQATMDVSTLTPDNFGDIVGKYLMQAGILDDDWPDWEDAVWVALTDGEEAGGMYEAEVRGTASIGATRDALGTMRQQATTGDISDKERNVMVQLQQNLVQVASETNDEITRGRIMHYADLLAKELKQALSSDEEGIEEL